MRQGVVPAPPVAELLPDPASQARFEDVTAALEAADLVRRMRRQALSVHGTTGISQEELARRTGLSQPRISQIETSAGRDGLSYAVLRRIAHACGINWGQMLREGLDRAPTGLTQDPAATADITQSTLTPSKRARSLPDAADRMIVEIDGAIREAWAEASALLSPHMLGKLPDSLPDLADRTALEPAVDDSQERLNSTKPPHEAMVLITRIGQHNLGADIPFLTREDVSPAVARTIDALNKLLEARTRLSVLMTSMDGQADAEAQLGKVLDDPASAELAAALKQNDDMSVTRDG